MTSPECTPKFKVGDVVWVRSIYQGVETNPPDGYPMVMYGMPSAGDEIPDSPALPAVARWLAETPGAVETLRVVAYHAMQNRDMPIRRVEKINELLTALLEVGRE